jgi:isoquinoline 1-oxidoreductase beta subunit
MKPTAAEREDIAALSRRTFLKTSVTAAGGLALTFAVPSWSGAAGSHQGNALNGFVWIDPDGRIHLTVPMVEMGQGIYTSHAMLLAEELEVELETVVLEHAPPNDALYANPILHEQSTGLSASMRGFWLPLRQAGAAARMMLVAAAAQRWEVDPATCTVRDGVIFDRSGKRSLPYRDVVQVAAQLKPPAIDQIRLKPSQEFTLIGTSTKRLEAADKVRGLTQFGIDVIVPGMKVAAIAISPVGGGKPKQVNKTAALAVKGVRQVVMIDEAVAVVADHTGAAKKGLEAAAIQWDDGANAAVSSASLLAQLKAGSESSGVVARNEGNVEQAFAKANRRFDAIYELPFLAHAAMEPMNCTVDLREDACEIWVGTQVPTVTQTRMAALTGLPKDAVVLHNQFLGGGVGRGLEPDGTLLAVKIAKHVDGSGQGDLEPRRGHPARHLPALLLRQDLGRAR